MKRLFRYMAWTITGIIVLLLFVILLFYLPFVQEYAKEKAVEYVASRFDMRVRVDKLSIGFPLNVKVENALAVTNYADTLLHVGVLHLDVRLRGIWKKRLAINELALRTVKLNFGNDTARVRIQVALDSLGLRIDRIDLQAHRVEADTLFLGGGAVRLDIKPSVILDTTAGKPFDWSFALKKINLRQVHYRMESSTLSQLVAGVVSTEISDGEVNIGTQRVTVGEVIVRRGNCLLETSPTSVPSSADTLPETNGASSSWVVEAGIVKVDNSAFRLVTGGVDRFDMVLSGIGVRVDSVYNRGTVVRGSLKDLKVVQHQGIRIDTMYAGVGLDTLYTRLSGAYIRTLHSEIRLDAHSDTTIAYIMKKAPLHVRLAGRIGLTDLEPFYNPFPEEVRYKQIDINTSLILWNDRIAVSRLTASMPGHFSLNGEGELYSFRDLQAVSGNIDIRGEFPDVTFANFFLKGKGVTIPKDVNISSQVEAKQGTVSTLTKVCQQEGCLTLEGIVRIPEKEYDVQAVLSRFYLSRFVPVDSLGSITASVRLTGSGYSWAETDAQAVVNLRQLFYKRHNYQRIHLEAGLHRTQLNGLLKSEDPALLLDLSFKGDSMDGKYAAKVNGAILSVDLARLNLATQERVISSDIEAKIAANTEQAYAVQLALNDLRISNGRRQYKLGNIALNMNSDMQKTELDVVSGDFSLAFRGASSVSAISGMFTGLFEELERQTDRRMFNIERLRQQLPAFTLNIAGAENNALRKFLQLEDMGFKKIDMQIRSSDQGGIQFVSKVSAPYYKKVQFDSVRLDVMQRDSSLDYSLTTVNSATEFKDLSDIHLSGNLGGNLLQALLKQKNNTGEIGVDLGMQLTISDSLMTIHFFPDKPTLGYRVWTINPDNQLTIAVGRKITANLHLNREEKRVDVQSLEDQGDKEDRLQVRINRIDLENILRNIPLIPDISGWLNADVELYAQKGELGVDGNIGITDFYYAKQRVGTVDLRMEYMQVEQSNDHAVDFSLLLDSIQRLSAQGKFSAAGSGDDIHIDMRILSMPLNIVSIFLPSDVLKLNGGLDGTVQVGGTPKQPSIQGEMAFRGANVELVMLGTAFELDSGRIAVKKNKILFNNYRLIAPNKSTLTTTGTVDLGNLSDIKTDLSLKAKRFQLVDVRQNTRSMVYGKAYADIAMTVEGALSELNVTGNVALLNDTEINYMLRSAALELRDKSVDLVRFVSFGDTTSIAGDTLVRRLNTSRFNLKVFVEIGNNVRANMNLSEGGENSVAIQGGGNLIYVMNPESGNSLAGKYTLTGGTVTYNVPVVGKKSFKIQSGSFVEWTGNIQNPELNITASESVKANVYEEGQSSRLVNFESIIRIQRTLQRPEITFDLSAPNDIPVQNQLSTFSSEERTKQAMNLLIYNSYTGPGALGSAGNAENAANNALYGFVENELNRHIRSSGFTLGVDTYNQYSSTGAETKRTDYTYQYSKHFLNDRINVKVGGRVSTDNSSAEEIEQNLIDDISIEYVFDRNKNLYLKIFRQTNYESALEGEVTQTGIGVVLRKSFRKVKDLFIRKSKRTVEVQGAGNKE